MAEFLNKEFASINNSPSLTGFKVVAVVNGLSANNNDTLTVPGITTVKGAFLISTTGVVGTMTFATNVITVTNGGALTWSGSAWGV